MKTYIIIPARYDSKRLYGKLLLPLAGKAIIEHVYDNLKGIEGIEGIIVATDSEKIEKHCLDIGCEVIMTSSNHISGTDRIAEAAATLDADLIINVQGDEPLIQPSHIQPIIDWFAQNDEAELATLYETSTDPHSFHNPNEVKLVCDAKGRAFYFSRNPIPYHHEEISVVFKKHIGVYAFRKSVLMQLSNLAHGTLEQKERLEQLRWMENGYRIQAIEVPKGLVSVDTEGDYNRLQRLLE